MQAALSYVSGQISVMIQPDCLVVKEYAPVGRFGGYNLAAPIGLSDADTKAGTNIRSYICDNREKASKAALHNGRCGYGSQDDHNQYKSIRSLLHRILKCSGSAHII